MAKRVFHLRGVDRHGKAIFKKRVRREQLINVIALTILYFNTLAKCFSF